MQRIAIGSVQFGMPYGIYKNSKVKRKEVFDILDFAKKSGIHVIDTAFEYGESEKVIGEYIESRHFSFDIVSKFPFSDIHPVRYFLNTSLKKLHTKNLYGYLFHNFEMFRRKSETFVELEKVKEEGLIKKVGFSLYYPHELEFLLKNKVLFDLIQLPYNILDQRFSPYFPILKKKGVEIHVRSIFLQDLLLINPNKLKRRFLKIKPKLTLLSEISQNLGLPISSICLNFVHLNNYIDKIVIGLRKKEYLENNLRALKDMKFVKTKYHDLKLLKEEDENIIIPINWK